MQLKKLLFINVLLIGSILLIAGCGSSSKTSIEGNISGSNIKQASCSIQGLGKNGVKSGNPVEADIIKGNSIIYNKAKGVPNKPKLQITCYGNTKAGDHGIGQVVVNKKEGVNKKDITIPIINILSSANTIGGIDIGSNPNGVGVAFTKNIPFHLSINNVENAPTDVTYAIISNKSGADAIPVDLDNDIDVYDLFKDVGTQTTFTVCMIAEGGYVNNCKDGFTPSIGGNILAVSTFKATLEPIKISKIGPSTVVSTASKIGPSTVVSTASKIGPSTVVSTIKQFTVNDGTTIATKSILPAQKGIVFSNSVPFSMPARLVTVANSDSVYITSNKVGIIPIKLEGGNTAPYTASDVKALFNLDKKTTFTICIVPTMTLDSTANGQCISAFVKATFTATLLPLKILPPSPILGTIQAKLPEDSKANGDVTSGYKLILPSGYTPDLTNLLLKINRVKFKISVANGQGKYLVVSDGTATTTAAAIPSEDPISGDTARMVTTNDIQYLLQHISSTNPKHLFICVVAEEYAQAKDSSKCASSADGAELTVSVKESDITQTKLTPATIDQISLTPPILIPVITNVSTSRILPKSAKWVTKAIGADYKITLPSTYKKGSSVDFGIKVKNGKGDYLVVSNGTDTPVVSTEIQGNKETDVYVNNIKSLIYGITPSSSKYLFICVLDKQPTEGRQCNSGVSLTVSLKSSRTESYPSPTPTISEGLNGNDNKIPSSSIWMGNAGDYVIGLPNTYQQGNQVNFVVNITNGNNKYFIISRGTKVESSRLISGNDKHEVQIDDISNLLTNMTPGSSSKPLSMCVLDVREKGCNNNTTLAELIVSEDPADIPPEFSEIITTNQLYGMVKAPLKVKWVATTVGKAYRITLPSTYQQGDEVNFGVKVKNGKGKYVVITNDDNSNPASGNVIKQSVRIRGIGRLLENLDSSSTQTLHMCIVEQLEADKQQCDSTNSLATLTVSVALGTNSVQQLPPGFQNVVTTEEQSKYGITKTPLKAIWKAKAIGKTYKITLPPTYQQGNPVDFAVQVSSEVGKYVLIGSGAGDGEKSGEITESLEVKEIDGIEHLLQNLDSVLSKTLYMCIVDQQEYNTKCTEENYLATVTVTIADRHLPPVLESVLTSNVNKTPELAVWGGTKSAYTIDLPNSYTDDPVNFAVNITNGDNTYFVISNGTDAEYSNVILGDDKHKVEISDISNLLTNMTPGSPSKLYMCVLDATNIPTGKDCNNKTQLATLTVSMQDPVKLSTPPTRDTTSTQQVLNTVNPPTPTTGLLDVSSEIEKQPSVVNWEATTVGKAYTITLPFTYQADDPVNFGVQVGNKGGKYLAISDGRAPSAAQIADTAPVVSVNIDNIERVLKNIDSSSPQTLYICIVENQMDSLQCNATNHQATLIVSMQDPIGLLNVSTEIEEQPSVVNWDAPTIGKAYTITLQSNYQAGDPVNFGVQVGNKGGKYLAISDGRAPSAAQIADTAPVVSVNMDDLSKFLKNIDSSSPQTLYICIVDTQMDSLQCNATNHLATLTVNIQ